MRVFIVVAAALSLSACKASSDRPADTLTQRERDSVIGASALPGAHGVQRALVASDSIAARNARADSAGR